MPYYDDGDTKIYHGDCLDVLPATPCHALITDPPFAFTGGVSNGRHAVVSEQFFLHWWRDVADRICKTVMPSGSGFIWCDWRSARAIEAGFESRDQERRLAISQMLFHYREMPGMGRPFRSSVDMIAYLRGPSNQPTKIPSTTHNFISEYWYYGKHQHHVAEKSVSIARRLIEWCSEPGETILDPFMGGGAVAVAAKEMGRKFVGIDREEECCETTVGRLLQQVILT